MAKAEIKNLNGYPAVFINGEPYPFTQGITVRTHTPEGIIFDEEYFRWYFCQETHVNHEVGIDCYAEPIRCSHDNGDGYLFYPGKPYGIYGPVESIRLHAIRDGFEEFEYLYLYETLCKKAGKDFRSEMAPLFSRLYEGVTVTSDASGNRLLATPRRHPARYGLFCRLMPVWHPWPYRL